MFRPLLIILAIVPLLMGCRLSFRRSSAPVPPSPVANTSPADASHHDQAPPAPAWTELGRSANGRPILAQTVGSGPLHVYLIAGIHGNETEGRAALPDLITALNRGPLASQATTRIIQDANPDGTVAHRRANANGRDLNRNWPAKNFASGRGGMPLSEPETRCIHADLLKFNPDVVIVLHSIDNGPSVNFDGPAGDLAQAFVSGAGDSRWHTVANMGYPTPGSLGSYIGVDRGIAILTVEFKRGQPDSSAGAALQSGLAAMIRSMPQVARFAPG